jgi:putative transposase
LALRQPRILALRQRSTPTWPASPRCVVHAVAVNKDGFRESLGLDFVTSEHDTAWLAFLRSLVARGLSGVELVTSGAHPVLFDAIQPTLHDGSAGDIARTGPD